MGLPEQTATANLAQATLAGIGNLLADEVLTPLGFNAFNFGVPPARMRDAEAPSVSST